MTKKPAQTHGAQPSFIFPIKKAIALEDLYKQIKSCGTENLNQAFNLYVASLETLDLPENVAASYLQVEVLAAGARLLKDSGVDVDKLQESMECPRFDAQPGGFARCCQWSYEVLMRLLDYHGRYYGKVGNLNIARARYFLDHNYTNADLMLKDAAAQAQMSASRFSTVFAREMGCTFTEYVTSLRVERACALLRETNMRISQIAAEVGYNDPHYFSWIFRKNKGVTPTEYRDEVLSN